MRFADHRIAGLSGVAAVALFAVANLLWALEQPAPDAPPAELVAFYEDASTRIVAGGLLSLSSLALFAVFGVAVRHVLADHGAGRVLPDLAFAGVLLGIAPGLGAETVNAAAAMRAGDDALSGDLAAALFDVSYVLGSYAAAPGFGLFAVALGLAALHSRSLLPRWLAIAALAVGGVLVVPVGALVLGEYVAVPAMSLIAAVAGRILRGAARPLSRAGA